MHHQISHFLDVFIITCKFFFFYLYSTKLKNCFSEINFKIGEFFFRRRLRAYLTQHQSTLKIFYNNFNRTKANFNDRKEKKRK
jgi:hypothetical protein